jgi:hypothetical protein
MIVAVISPHDVYVYILLVFFHPKVLLFRYFFIGSSLESIQIQSNIAHPRGAVTKSGAQSLVSTQDAAAKTARHTQCVSS